jgi:CheY-specific phosphatase CheX
MPWENITTLGTHEVLNIGEDGDRRGYIICLEDMHTVTVIASSMGGAGKVIQLKTNNTGAIRKIKDTDADHAHRHINVNQHFGIDNDNDNPVVYRAGHCHLRYEANITENNYNILVGLL